MALVAALPPGKTPCGYHTRAVRLVAVHSPRVVASRAVPLGAIGAEPFRLLSLAGAQSHRPLTVTHAAEHDFRVPGAAACRPVEGRAAKVLRHVVERQRGGMACEGVHRQAVPGGLTGRLNV